MGNAPTGKLTAELNGKSYVTLNVGTYSEEGFKSIEYITYTNGKVDVSSSAKIKYQINVNTTLKEFNTAKELEEYINTLEAGTYKITYVITYLNNQETKTRTIILR